MNGVSPSGVATKRVVVFRGETGPDSPFWTVDGVGLDNRIFPLPADLVARLRNWCQTVWEVADETKPWEPWNAEGRMLFEETAVLLSPEGFDLRWDPDNDARGRPSSTHRRRAFGNGRSATDNRSITTA